MIVEYLTDRGAWERSCAHVVDETETFPVEQFRLDGESDHSTAARCGRCGEWFTITNRQEILI